jgi:two-component system phosphate regulon sensor histidine kinase PhoR
MRPIDSGLQFKHTHSNDLFTVLEKIIATSNQAIIVVDEMMRICAANAVAAEAFSKNSLPLKNRRLTEVFRDLYLNDAFRLALSEKKRTNLRLEINSLAVSRLFDVSVNGFDLAGQKLAIGYFQDVTEIERLEKARREFLSNISHELRTPLTSIMAFVETLEAGAIDDPENNKRFISVIRRNAERMNALLSDILELSYIESGNISINKVSVHLSRLVAEIFDNLSSKAETKQVTLLNEVDSEYRILADPGRLEQMLTNLIDNAIKFNRDGGKVTVSAVFENRRAKVSVTDTGDGILPEHLPRIFERFYRADRSRSAEIGGTGLGLAIVKHLAKLSGGEVIATSELGRGSTFTLDFPADIKYPD